MKFIILNGKGCAGKDTFKQCVIDLLDAEEISHYETSIINPVKNLYKDLILNPKKDCKYRSLLYNTKKALEAYNKDLLLKQIINEIIDFCDLYEEQQIIFIDMREKRDIQKFVKLFPNTLTVLIKNDKKDNIIYGNRADDEVFNYNYDVTINNDGTLFDLQLRARDFYQKYIKGEDVNG